MKQYIEKFLTNDRITLRKISKDDYEEFYEMEDVVESQLLMNDDIPFPKTKSDHEKFLSEVNPEKDEYIFAIELKDEQIFIGTISVYAVNWKNSTCHVGVSIGPAYQGKGFGTEAMRILIDFIFNYMNLNKVKLQVFSFNKRAVASYEKCGFSLEGTLREELFRFGKFHDVYDMGLLRKDWLNLQI